MLKNYIAVSLEKGESNAFDKAHLTLSFGDVKETQKLSMKKLTSFFPCSGTITKVVYWPHVNLTVALIDSETILEAQKYCESVGFDYNLDFIPHVTLGASDLAIGMKNLEGKRVHFHDVYIRQKEF